MHSTFFIPHCHCYTMQSKPPPICTQTIHSLRVEIVCVIYPSVLNSVWYIGHFWKLFTEETNQWMD